MSGGVDEVQAAVDARVLDVTVTHRRELLAKVCAVLVLNILYNWVPATTSKTLLSTHFLETGLGKCHSPILIVNLVTITGSIDDVKAQSDPVFCDNYLEAHT